MHRKVLFIQNIKLLTTGENLVVFCFYEFLLLSLAKLLMFDLRWLLQVVAHTGPGIVQCGVLARK